MDEDPRPNQALIFGMVGEMLLAVISLLLGWLSGVNVVQPFLGRTLSVDLTVGFFATLPLLLGMLLVDRSHLALFKQLRDVINRMILPFLSGASVWMLALISLAAGIGEELLFRGLIQQGLAQGWSTQGGSAEVGFVVAWLVAGVLFGLAHAMTRGYFILAVLAGLYLGFLYWYFESLLIPITCHAFYDFFALLYLMRRNE
ncbi:MAG: CPBP family intramembrane metalloprotease [Planctomycetaceae bacterium]|nr:CPBP family intramembrane metalloprotease [Planctomycetaceae bacterium]